MVWALLISLAIYLIGGAFLCFCSAQASQALSQGRYEDSVTAMKERDRCYNLCCYWWSLGLLVVAFLTLGFLFLMG